MAEALRNSVAIHALEREVVRVGRAMQRAGLVAGTAGNASVRLPGGHFLVTPSGLPKGRLAPRDLLVVDGEGLVVRGRAAPGPTTEMPMHLEVYRRRPDVNAVVHAHPVHAVALSLVGDDLQRCSLPEAVTTFGAIAVTPYSPPSSRENAQAVTEAILGHDVIVLAYHGSLTVGATLEEAYLRLEVLEHTARILAVARSLGPVASLSEDEVRALRRTGRDYAAAARVTASRGRG